MIKNTIIGILVLITLLSITYAFFQQTAANKARIQAEQNLILAEDIRKEADLNASEAKKQSERAVQALEKCKGK